MANTVKNKQIKFRLDDNMYHILKRRIEKSGMTMQEYFENQLRKPIRYVDTSIKNKMAEINTELNNQGHLLNNINKRIINENIYESDINTMFEIIEKVKDYQNQLLENIEEYFKR